MKPRLIESDPEEVIAALPILHQDVPTITRLRAELRLLSRLIALPNVMGMLGVGTIMGIGGLMMWLRYIFPTLAALSEQPGKTNPYFLLWLMVIGINFGGCFGLLVVLPIWIDWRIRGREAAFCDVQLIGDLIDMTQAIESADSRFQRGWYAGCLLAWLKRTLPEIGVLETDALTDRQQDFLAEKALTWQSAQEEFVVTIVRSAPIWGDIETLAAIVMLSQTAESEALRAAACAGSFPLKVRLLAAGEDSALIDSLGILSVPNYEAALV